MSILMQHFAVFKNKVAQIGIDIMFSRIFMRNYAITIAAYVEKGKACFYKKRDRPSQ